MVLPPPSSLRGAVVGTSGHYGELPGSEAVTAYAGLSESLDPDDAQALFNVRLCLSVFEDLGVPVERDHTILDLGCGEGRMVYWFRKLGYQAFGMDIVSPLNDCHLRMAMEGLSEPEERVLAIDGNGEVPFPDNHFDIVVSWEVMEHVQNHEQVLSEIRRVLKPAGKSLHYFPARHRLLEPHISVPFASVCQAYWYLLVWAKVGVKGRSQADLTAEEAARNNFNFLRTSTNYLTKSNLASLVQRYFGSIRFVEEHLWKHNSGKTGFLYRTLSGMGLARLIPTATKVLSPFAHRVIYFEKPQ